MEDRQADFAASAAGGPDRHPGANPPRGRPGSHSSIGRGQNCENLRGGGGRPQNGRAMPASVPGVETTAAQSRHGLRFTPLDNYFDRYYNPEKAQINDMPPLDPPGSGQETFLWRASPAGNPKFGPSSGNTIHANGWKAGKIIPTTFAPGEAIDTFICTDGGSAGDPPAIAPGWPSTITRGAFLWRIPSASRTGEFKGRHGLCHGSDRRQVHDNQIIRTNE